MTLSTLHQETGGLSIAIFVFYALFPKALETFLWKHPILLASVPREITEVKVPVEAGCDQKSPSLMVG